MTRTTTTTTIYHRDTQAPIYTSGMSSLIEAVEEGVEAEVDLGHANFTEADFRWGHFGGGSFAGATFARADLADTYFFAANCTAVDFTHADLSHADLTHADLAGAKIACAKFSGAKITLAQLRSADTSEIRDHFHAILAAVPNEVPGLRVALIDGTFDGSLYQDERACLIGTIANLKECCYCDIPGITPDERSPAERWFCAIGPDDTPESSPFAALALEWLDEWTRKQQEKTARTA